MSERFDTIVIGAGQAGLSTSYLLTRRSRDHLVLERGRVGETWRSERWDSFRLNTPNWFLRLPGHEYDGDDREGFLTCAETVSYLERYAQSADGSLRTGVDVQTLSGTGDGLRLETSAGPFTARNVVVATGSFRRQTPRPVATSKLLQLHSSEYRNPEQLPEGAVLVVGAAQSGCQIAAELNRAGRDVYLSLGRCPSLPLLYRGRRIYDWIIDVGMMDETVDKLPSPAARLAGNPTVASADVDHLVGPLRLAREGVTLVGRVEALDERRAHIQQDAAERLAEANGFLEMVKQRIDDHVAANALDLPEDEAAPGRHEVVERAELDLRAAGVKTVIWANGYRPDFGWIEFPIVDSDGWPLQDRGVTEVEGLYFVGVHWLRKRKSALFLGVGEDAEHIVSTIVDGRRTKEER
jgi:putative flavoprotein involved in K+ transport